MTQVQWCATEPIPGPRILDYLGSRSQLHDLYQSARAVLLDSYHTILTNAKVRS